MSVNEDHPMQIEVKLSMTGYSVILNGFMTVKQFREFNEKVLGEGQYDPTAKTLQNVKVEGFLMARDALLGQLIKSIKDKEGVEIPFTQEWLDNLPQPDGQLIYDAVQKVIDASTLTEEAKKK